MALKSGRVGVAPDQVDVYGRLKGGSPSPTPGGGLKVLSAKIPQGKKLVVKGFNTLVEENIFAMADIRVGASIDGPYVQYFVTGAANQPTLRYGGKSNNMIVSNPTGAITISTTATCDLMAYVVDYCDCLELEITDV